MATTYSKLRSDEPRVQEARRRAGRIVNAMNDLATLVQEAWDSGDHRTLGYETWQSYTVGEFGHGDTAIKARQVIVSMLRGTGLSQRAIAAQTGASVGTVHNDIADLTTEPPEGDPATRDRRTTAQPVEQSATVTGLDGRVRAATRSGMDGDERRARRRERDLARGRRAITAPTVGEAEIRHQEELEAQREVVRSRLRAPAGNLTPAELEANHRYAGRSGNGVIETPPRDEAREELTQRHEARILLAAKFSGQFRQWLDTLDGDQLDTLDGNWETVMDTAMNAMKSWITAQRQAG